MKKFFLIPLMTLFSCVMAWATDAHVSNITDLKAAVADASVETIYLEDDIAYTSETVGSQINICRSLTLDGQGHTLKGCAKRTSSGNYNVLSINHNGSQMVDVTIKNITLTGKYNKDHKANKPVETRGNIHSLTLIDVVIDNQDGPSGNNQGLTIGGAQGTTADITLTRTQILMNSSSYPVVVFNPINLTMTDSKTLGYCSLFFKPDTYGGNNSTVVATNCDLDAPNPHSYTGGFNSFGLFVMQYGINGVNITLNNCGMNAQVTGNSAQGMFVSQGDNNLTITGDNSHINGEFVISNEYKSRWLAYAAGHITITGGTYAQDPSNIGTVQCYTFDEYDNIVVDGDNNPVLVPCEVNCVPEGYEVKEITMEGVATPLYRVVKKAARDGEDKLYDLNDNVQSQGDGQNPTTSFELSDGSPMILNQETTKAGYVEVSNGTTVTVATDQTLVINNGLDVQGTSVVTANPGSALVIGEGGKISQGTGFEDENKAIIAELKNGAYNDNYAVTFTPGNLIFGASALVLDPTVATLATQISEAAATGEKYNVTFDKLTMKANEWYAMVLPFDVDPKEMVYAADRYVIFNELNVAGTTAEQFKFTLKFEPIPAGTPFLIKFAGKKDEIINWADYDLVTAGNQPIAFNGVDISAAPKTVETPYVNFTGTYEKGKVVLQGSRTNGSENYVWWLCDTRYERSTRVNDWLKPVNNPHTVAPMEAWLDGNESAWKATYAPIITVEDFDGQTTSIQTLNAGEINGLNVANEGWYTINGVKLESAPTQKGIYIFNGKKVAVQ